MFLQLVIKELDSGFKGNFHTMTMHGYRAVAKAFKERTHKVHDVKQLQNKYTLLKKDWQSWSCLMDSRHGPTGISYNEATGLIQAFDDWWAHYEKIDKNALRFKMKPLEHMDLMRRVYEGATATGKFAWTLGAAFEPVATEDNPLLVDEEDCEDKDGLSLSTIRKKMNTLSTTLVRKRRTPQSLYMLHHWQFTLMTHPQRKKGKVREHRSWRVA
ncbi:hypothetical protein LOK49_LG06G03384 [Camellia lanceoleosa]|uniref:Uncharacterized protein n=1 Tax=Camellia lanceoleosa TaxID=1840588 RepID=A0ACC0HCJ2_9ERIC|nr:hypothetical protein LOK49_LG06G03384 [Camellia lanceoleosa]